MASDDLRLTWYGDDFTGSTDVLEALTLAGLRAVLFLEPPRADQLQGRWADLQAIGLAGRSRAMTPVQMDVELPPLFEQLKRLGAPLCHYKTCSTFDSSARIGSIGRAIDIGAAVFGSRPVPLVVGAPALRRYVVFGHLFATVGRETFRLDRHPTMSRHPVTPMTESDLRRHLAEQTDKSIALFDILHLAGDPDRVAENFIDLRQTEPEIVLFDTVDQDHLAQVGRLVWEGRGAEPGFVAGSSGLEYALTAYWQQAGLLPQPKRLISPGPVEQMVVMAGSASPVTAEQIAWGRGNGFAAIRLDTVRLVDPATAEAEAARCIEDALLALGRGQSVIVYTAAGPDDPAVAATRRRAAAVGRPPAEAGQYIGQQQGDILRQLLAASGIRRVCIAGGDTSSYAAPRLGIYALEMIVPTAPGSPLCRASAHEAAFAGLEIALKGGQVGQADYFGLVRAGGG